MKNLISLEMPDKGEEIYGRIKGKKFICIVEDCNGKVEVFENKITPIEAVYFMNMAIHAFIRKDLSDSD